MGGIMINTKWNIDQILDYVNDCFILENKLLSLDSEDLDRLTEKHKKQLRRIMHKDLTEGKDYYLEGKNKAYTMYANKAKLFINTNIHIRKYFLREMYEDRNRLEKYFFRKNKQLNRDMEQKNQKYYDEYYIPAMMDATNNFISYEDNLNPRNDDILINEARDFLLSIYQIEDMFDYYRIDAETFLADFEKRKQCIAPEATAPFDNDYAFLDFKLRHPSIYYPQKQ